MLMQKVLKNLSLTVSNVLFQQTDAFRKTLLKSTTAQRPVPCQKDNVVFRGLFSKLVVALIFWKALKAKNSVSCTFFYKFIIFYLSMHTLINYLQVFLPYT